VPEEKTLREACLIPKVKTYAAPSTRGSKNILTSEASKKMATERGLYSTIRAIHNGCCPENKK
jgi:hypothetical protein